MNADSARHEVFGDSLACEEVRPAAFSPGPLSPAAARTACLRGESLLRSLAVVEDSRGGRQGSGNERRRADLLAGERVAEDLVPGAVGVHRPVAL